MTLERFTEAQEGVWPAPLDEIRAGAKRTHWMWFVWPQLRGLGRSSMAQHFGIEGMDEARTYLAHDLLGPRLLAISEAMLRHEGQPPEAILGPVDALKLRSSATLFEAAGGAPVFAALLSAFHDEERCPKTVQMLGQG